MKCLCKIENLLFYRIHGFVSQESKDKHSFKGIKSLALEFGAWLKYCKTYSITV